jgi:streptogrisin C
MVMIQRSLSILVLALMAVSAAARSDSPPSAALLQDAASYAARYGVDVDEAVHRLRLQREIGDLDAALSEEEEATYAGLWIEHEPRYRVVVRFTDPAGERRLRTRIAGGPLAELVETRPARWTLAQLQAQQQEVRTAARRARVGANSDINVFENRVELQVVDPQTANLALASMRAPLPPAVEITRVDGLAVPQALLTGGSLLSTCTAGFVVVTPNYDAGVLTAGHCPDQQSFEGMNLPFRGQAVGGDQDVQWHSGCRIAQMTGLFNSGLDLRPVERTRSRIGQPIGQYVCKFGKATGRTCGVLSSKYYDPGTGFNATFMYVKGGTVNLSEEGDSGGPWFVELEAYGIQSGAPNGGNSNDAYYMAINYISSLGVSVLASSFDPVAGCNIPPVAKFTMGTTFTGTVNFDASASYDPDGRIVRYQWDFGDGTTATTTTPTTTHPYPRETNTYSVTLTVTDNEDKHAGLTRELAICYPKTDCIGPL